MSIVQHIFQQTPNQNNDNQQWKLQINVDLPDFVLSSDDIFDDIRGEDCPPPTWQCAFEFQGEQILPLTDYAYFADAEYGLRDTFYAHPGIDLDVARKFMFYAYGCFEMVFKRVGMADRDNSADYSDGDDD